ncbi:MDR family MFS transporter [Falsibacillus pallidus]|uniref:Putative MFS family arabinose efflux permease n=1 Tax=Falsibacillus pallidus TaxID=493781 RepID=A0A370GKP8_9BACI|nr:MFS transporter [Falsibacillus pallidus]RDI44342.1 putative MFS family arabinose efflux permease [Falsibacillus pallidus]
MPKQLWLLVIGMMVNVTGSSFLWPLNTIYIHDQLGKSLSTAGLVLMLNSAASVIGNLMGGTMFDKKGGYRTILAGLSITILALFGLTLMHSWIPYILFLALVGFGSGMIFPAMFAMGGAVWPEGGRKAFNAIYVAQNAGVAIGSALGGLVASYSFSYIFIANLLMYGIFLMIAVLGYRNINVEGIRQSSILSENSRIKNKNQFKALLILCSGYLLCWITYVQWQSTIASYTQQLHIPLKSYSLLWTINGALIVLGQPIVGVIVKKVLPSTKKQIMLGITIFMVSFVVVGFAHQFSGFLIAMIILTIGEMFVWPAVPTIANKLAPKGREGFYQGVVNSTATGGRMLGPLIGGIMADGFDMKTLFMVLIGLLVIAFLITTVFDKIFKADSNVTKAVAS